MGSANDCYILFSQSLFISLEPFQRSSRLKEIIYKSDKGKEATNHDHYIISLYDATIQSNSEIKFIRDPERYDELQ